MNKILWALVIFLVIGLQLEYNSRQYNEEKMYDLVDRMGRQQLVQSLIVEYPDLFKNVSVK